MPVGTNYTISKKKGYAYIRSTMTIYTLVPPGALLRNPLKSHGPHDKRKWAEAYFPGQKLLKHLFITHT